MFSYLITNLSFAFQNKKTKKKLTMRTALSRSQSLKIMKGDFPPSSRETFFRLLTAQDFMIT